MRGAFVRQFGGPETLSIENGPDPQPGPGEVVVDIAATAVNYVDLLVIGGKYQFLPPLPFIPGKLPAGTIAAVGPEVAGWKVGDRVQTLAEQGGYASKVCVPAKECIRLPDKMNFVDAAAMALAYDTAWFALCERARAQKGETLLVLGASGGVGLAAVQLGKAYGLRVLAAINGSAKPEMVMDAGADATIDHCRARSARKACASRFSRKQKDTAPMSCSIRSVTSFSTPQFGRSLGADVWWLSGLREARSRR